MTQLGTEIQSKKRTFDRIIPTPREQRPAVHRKNQRTRLRPLRMRAFDRLIRPHQVRVRLPEV